MASTRSARSAGVLTARSELRPEAGDVSIATPRGARDADERRDRGVEKDGPPSSRRLGSARGVPGGRDMDNEESTSLEAAALYRKEPASLEADEPAGFVTDVQAAARDKVEWFEELFCEFDVNGDGRLDSAELQDLLYAAGMAVTKHEADETHRTLADDNGCIDKDRFVSFMFQPKPAMRFSMSEGSANAIVLQAQLISRFIKRRLKHLENEEEEDGGRQKDEPIDFKVLVKVGEPKPVVQRARRKPLLTRKFSKFSRNGGKYGHARGKSNLSSMDLKADIEIFPDIMQTQMPPSFPPQITVNIKFAGRPGIERSRVCRLGDDLKPILEHACQAAVDSISDLGSGRLRIESTHVEVTSESGHKDQHTLAFRVTVAGEPIDKLQCFIQEVLSVPLSRCAPLNGSATCEVGIGLSADDLTSNSDDVWNQAVTSRLDQATYFRAEGKIGTAAFDAAKLLAASRAKDRALAEKTTRILRALNLKITFLRITDALQAALADNLNADVFKNRPGVQELCRQLLNLKIGHLVPFAQLLPRWIAGFLGSLNIGHLLPFGRLMPQWVIGLLAHTKIPLLYQPKHWLRIINEMAKCMQGVSGISMAFLPSLRLNLQLTGFDLLAGLARQPLTEYDLPATRGELESECTELEKDVQELFNALRRSAPKMACKTWDERKPHFYFLPRAQVLDCKEAQLPRMQVLRDANKLVKKQVELAEAFRGRGIIKKVLFVSHRWEDRASPDRLGKQLEAIQSYLRDNEDVELIWFDYSCMPQRKDPDEECRTKEERTEFRLMLQTMTNLYLTARVLILLDGQYVNRFWPMTEAWCSMMKVTSKGVVLAPEAERRCTIVCLHSAEHSAEHDKAGLMKKISVNHKPAQMCKLLEDPDIFLTNQKDKSLMLPIVAKTNESVRALFKEVMSVAATESRPDLLC